MQTVMSNFIKLLFCLWQGACWDSFLMRYTKHNEDRNNNTTPTYKLWRDIAGLCLANGIGKNGASSGYS